MKAAIVLLALGSFGPGASLVAQDEVRKNDAFVPIAEEAARFLGEGDLLLLRARTKRDEGEELDPAELRKAFEAWRRALTSALDEETSRFSRVPCVVPTAEAATEAEIAALLPTESESNRRLEDRTEHVSVAVQRRLSTLSSSERAAWTERFEPLAETELRAAGSEARIERIEAEFPRTSAAARAALRKADIALERGRTNEAHAWLERAARHSGESVPSRNLREAVRVRRDALSSFSIAAEFSRDEPWREAKRLSIVDEIDLGLRRTRFEDDRLGFDRGVLSGAVRLGPTLVAAQYPDAVLLLDKGRTRALFDPRALLVNFESVRVGPSFAPAGSAWPLHPKATPEGDLVLVLGRSIAGGSSCLIRVTPPSPPLSVDTAVTELSPELGWAVTPRGRLAPGPDGKIRLVPSLLPDGSWEFQPGPLVSGGRVLCQARRWDVGDNEEPLDLARPEAWLLAFDASNGELIASRFIAKGTDVHRDPGRFQEARVITPAQPPALVPGGILCGTGIGVAALLGAGDLRVEWTFLLDRRGPNDTGWAAFEAPLVVSAAPTPYALLGAAESDWLYALRLTADALDEGLFIHEPQPIGEARALCSADARGYLNLGRRGARRTLFRMEWSDTAPRRIDAVDARVDEKLRGSGLASEARAYFTTDKTLYLFDLTADLMLLETVPLALGGGALIGAGDLVYVVSDGGVTVLRPE